MFGPGPTSSGSATRPASRPTPAAGSAASTITSSPVVCGPTVAGGTDAGALSFGVCLGNAARSENQQPGRGARFHSLRQRT